MPVFIFKKGLKFFGAPETINPEFLGGKAAGLVRMTEAGFNVPPGVVIPTTDWVEFNKLHTQAEKVEFCQKRAEAALEMFGDYVMPDMHHMPLVSVRSGARVSMPGMMDTILNVGLTDESLWYWKAHLGDRAALDCYRRLIQMYGQTVAGIKPKYFHSALKETMASKYGMSELPKSESLLPVPHLVKLIEKYKAVYKKHSGTDFPQTREEQVAGSIYAVFDSWNSERAKEYRKVNGFSDDWGTAVTIQTMVFGNLNDQSCSGVLFSRCPSTGVNSLTGEFLPNAQGEEVVAGTATPKNLLSMLDWSEPVYMDLTLQTIKLEKMLKDMVDVEFTVESGNLYILQVRPGKRSAQAAFKVAYDMALEGIITKEEALKRVTGAQYQTLSKKVIDPNFKDQPILIGIAASNGMATGKIWKTSAKAKDNPGGILVTKETTPDDFPGMAKSAGILTQTGGSTSHAAVVARGMDKACVVGATSLNLDAMVEGEVITIDGSTGRVWLGEVPMVGGVLEDHVETLISWGKGSVAGMLKVVVKPETVDMIPQSGHICLELDGDHTEESMEKLFTALSTRKELSGLLNTTVSSTLTDKETKMLCFMGLGTGIRKVSEEVLKALGKASSDWISRWDVVVPEEINMPATNVRLLQRATNLGDLLKASGYVELDQKLLKVLVDQGVTETELFDFLVKGGSSVKKVPEFVDYDQMIVEILG